jgi:uncharacterized protein YjbI with pentapeptide repeats
VTLVGSTLQDVRLNGSTVSETTFQATNWRDVQISGYRISGSTFQNCELADVELRDQLQGAGMERATWTNCKLRDVRFLRCNLTGAQISDVDIADMRVDSVDFSNRTIKGNEEFGRIAGHREASPASN